ncbi:MAG TPA: hypothetical protein VFF73_37165, partial [Planctomycetota bacterium]|nr:hypothetical protein [Planctomycetota bacterium]
DIEIDRTKCKSLTGNLVNSSANGTQLSVIAPPGAPGPVTITVKNLDGLSATLANAFVYSTGPMFPALSGPIAVTPGSTFTGSFAARDPGGKTPTYAFSPPVANLSVDTNGNVTFTPSPFQAGTLTAVLTATGTGTSSLSITFAVSRLGSPSILFSDNAVFPGAPAGAGLATPLPAPTTLSSVGAFAAQVSFVATTTVGVLYRAATAGVGSSVVSGAIAPASGITIVAAGGSSAGGNLVFRDPTSQFLVGSTGADGTASFVALVTSDRTTTDPPDFAQALYLVSPTAALTGPLAQTGTASPNGGTFSSLVAPVSDGAGGAYFAAQVTSSTNAAVLVNALLHAAGSQVTLVAQEGSAAGAAGTLQAGQPITTIGAASGSVVCLVTTQLGACLVEFAASGQATEIAAKGLVLDGGAHTLQSIVAAKTSTRSLAVSGLVNLDAGATDGVYVFSPLVGRIVRQGDALLGGTVNAIASLSTAPEDATDAVTEQVALSGASATAALVRALPGGAISIVIDDTSTVVPTSGGTFSTFVGLGSGGGESSWASAIAGGSNSSGLFELSQGTQVSALILEAQPLPGGLSAITFGSFAAVPATVVHPESGLVVTTVPVNGGVGFSQVVVAR